MILVCYDGSADSEAAIARAGTLMPGADATVLTVWEPYMGAMSASGGLAYGYGMPPEDADGIDAATERAACARAAEGAQLARRAGLNAQPRTCARTSSVQAAICATAEELGVGVIVVGTRGLTGVKSVLLGSVSDAVVHHAHRPVLVVPGAKR